MGDVATLFANWLEHANLQLALFEGKFRKSSISSWDSGALSAYQIDWPSVQQSTRITISRRPLPRDFSPEVVPAMLDTSVTFTGQSVRLMISPWQHRHECVQPRKQVEDLRRKKPFSGAGRDTGSIFLSG